MMIFKNYALILSCLFYTGVYAKHTQMRLVFQQLRKFSQTTQPYRRSRQAADKIHQALHDVSHWPDYVQPYCAALKLSSHLFMSVPGYQKTMNIILSNLHDPSLAKGHAYEIEYALHLMRDEHEIKAFNYVIEDPNGIRQIDIQTNTCMVECKNINWQMGNKMQLKKQFKDQKRIITFLNTLDTSSYQYIVSSCNPIPLEWKNWFWAYEIPFIEAPEPLLPHWYGNSA